MTYRHTQSSPQLAALLVVALVATVIAAVALGEPVLLLASAVLACSALLGVALSSLTTTVTSETITVAFRWGRPRRVIPCRQVERAEVVRNSWWHGWGIRWIPGATMYNVWGLDAVHLELADRRDFRIGTDDPHGLAAAIDATDDPGR